METLSSLLTPNDFKFINEYNELVKKVEELKPFLFMSNYRGKRRKIEDSELGKMLKKYDTMCENMDSMSRKLPKIKDLMIEKFPEIKKYKYNEWRDISEAPILCKHQLDSKIPIICIDNNHNFSSFIYCEKCLNWNDTIKKYNVALWAFKRTDLEEQP